MSRAWMPLYVGDFLANTTHLNATETGIYIRLIMHCWENGHLPADPEKLRIISHASAKSWNRYCNILSFFDRRESEHGLIYVHSRVSQERLKYEELSNKRKAAALQKHTQSQSHIDPEAKASGPTQADLERELFRRGKQVCGYSSGGLIASLLKAKEQDVALARAVVEVAATKSSPREYIGGVIRNKGHAKSDPTMEAFDNLIRRAEESEGHSDALIVDIATRRPAVG